MAHIYNGTLFSHKKNEMPFVVMWMQLEIIMLSQSKSEIDNLLAYLLSLFSHAQLFVTLWTVTHQAPLSLAFFKQEYWSGLPCLLQWIFPKQGSNPYLLCLLHWRWVLYPMSHQGSPDMWVNSFWTSSARNPPDNCICMNNPR